MADSTYTSGNYIWNGKAWVTKDATTGAMLPSGVQPGTYDESGNYVPIAMGTGKNAATNTTANILRGNYNNWKETYFPVLQDMLGQTTYSDPSIVGEETAKATQQVNNAYQVANTNTDNTMARYGLTADPSTKSNSALAQVAAQVGAQNQTRQYLADRDRSIMTGMPSPVSSSS